MRVGLIVAIMAAATASAAQAKVAIRCSGTVEFLGDKSRNGAQSRIYLIDDSSQMVSLYDESRESFVPICLDGETCAKSFGSKGIRIVRNAMMFDLNRMTGEISYFNRKSNPPEMENFDGKCEKTAVPKSATKPKF